MLSRLTSRLSRAFCSQLQSAQGSSLSDPLSSSLPPVHLRPYDKSRYEVPMEKIKSNSGYAFLQIEPFPRAKIMKTCYHILEQLSKGFPEDCVYRIYNEERTKYFMKLVDENNDIEVLEEYFGVETIELFIDNLVKQLEVINIMRHSKIWEMESSTAVDQELVSKLTPPQHTRKPAYKKGERARASFVEE